MGEPFVENAIENLPFIKDYSKLPEKDKSICEFLINTAKYNTNFEESISYLQKTTDLFYRPLTIEDLFIKEVNPITLKENTIFHIYVLMEKEKFQEQNPLK